MHRLRLLHVARRPLSFLSPRACTSSAHATARPRRRLAAAAAAVAVAAAAAATAAALARPPPRLNDRSFAPYTLVAKDAVSPTCAVYTLRPAAAAHHAPPRAVWSVEVKQPQLQIARSYTPLPPSSDAGDRDLRLLVRRQPRGELSRYLDGLAPGARVELRGPRVECALRPDVAAAVVVAGGTAIAAALQAAEALLAARPTASVRILWASRRREECGDGDARPGAVAAELRRLRRRHGGRLVVDCFVDEEGSFISAADIRRAADDAAPAGPNRLLLVAGPDGFVEHFAGPRTWGPAGQGQGPVGGVIGRLGLRAWTVVKL